MSAYALLNLLNELGKSDKMLDSIYHMMLQLFCNHVFGMKTSRLCHIYMQRCYWGSFYNFTKFRKPLVVYRF